MQQEAFFSNREALKIHREALKIYREALRNQREGFNFSSSATSIQDSSFYSFRVAKGADFTPKHHVSTSIFNQKRLFFENNCHYCHNTATHKRLKIIAEWQLWQLWQYFLKILSARARARECKMARKTGNAWASKQRASIARTFQQSPEVHYPRLSHQNDIRKYFPALIVRNGKKRSKGLPLNKIIYTFGAHS